MQAPQGAPRPPISRQVRAAQPPALPRVSAAKTPRLPGLLARARTHKIAIDSYLTQCPPWTTLRTQVGHLARSEKFQKHSFTGLRKEGGSAHDGCAPFVILDAGFLLTWAVLDHLLDLLLHRI